MSRRAGADGEDLNLVMLTPGLAGADAEFLQSLVESGPRRLGPRESGSRSDRNVRLWRIEDVPIDLTTSADRQQCDAARRTSIDLSDCPVMTRERI